MYLLQEITNYVVVRMYLLQEITNYVVVRMYLLQEITNYVVVRSIKDVDRKGQPNKYVTRMKVSDFKALVNEDCRYTVEDITSKVGILEGGAHTTLTQNFEMKKDMRTLGAHLQSFPDICEDCKKLTKRLFCQKVHFKVDEAV
jgi:hypothetical protein